MTLPPPLQQLADRYNELVANFTAGHIAQEDALAILASTSVVDASGAIWAVNQEGAFTRADFPGSPAVLADPAQFLAAGSPLPASPAFPSPVGFPPPAMDLDTPPTGQHWGTPPTGPAPVPGTPLPVPVPPGQEPRKAKKVKTKSIKADGEPGTPNPVVATLTGFFAQNKVFAIILLVGALVISAAFFVPKMTGGGGTQMPTDTTTTLPGEPTGGDQAPPATAAVPSTTDAATVTAALQSGDPAQIQSVIVTPLDAITMLRTQALWTGLAQTGVTITAQPAAQTEATKATQVWVLTRDGDTTAVASITVTWTTDGTTWKVDQAPAF